MREISNLVLRWKMFYRRSVLTGLALCLLDISFVYPNENSLGCSIEDNQLLSKLTRSPGPLSFNIETDYYSNGSGNREFDRALAHTLAKLSDIFGVLPGFAFFDEDAGKNAFASRSSRLGREDGSVLFGNKLLAYLMQEPNSPETGVAAVCAHEFGHIVQYKLGIERHLISAIGQVKRLELHADFLAGYFAGRRKLENDSFPAVRFAATQDMFGDTNFNHPNHHGTSVERGAAVVSGYQCGFNDRQDFASAVRSGVSYVQDIPL